MADQIPPNPSETAPEALTPSFLDKFNMDVGQLWSNHKLFLIFFGLIIIIIKFREVIIDILVSSGKTLLSNANKQNAALSAQEDSANKQADELIKKAQDEPTKNTPSDDDWYKK